MIHFFPLFHSRLKIFSGWSYFDVRFVFSDSKYIRIVGSPPAQSAFFLWACVIFVYLQKLWKLLTQYKLTQYKLIPKDSLMIQNVGYKAMGIKHGDPYAKPNG